MPHGGGGHGPSKGPGNTKKGVGGSCNAPSKPVDNIPTELEPIVISNSRPDVMCPELFEACRAGKVERVRRLIAHEGVSATATDYNGQTCFHSTCLAGQEKVLELLLEEYPAFLWQSTDKGITPLMFACDNNQVRIAQYLLLRKADPHAASKDGTTALMKAASRGGSECVELLLGEAKVDVNARNEEGFTALLYAAMNGRTTVVKTLLDAGADSSAKLVVGTSAKALAQAGDHDATVKALDIHYKLQARKAAKDGQAGYAATAPTEDTRALDDIMAELDGGEPAVSSSKKKSKKKSAAKVTHGEPAPAAETPLVTSAGRPATTQPTGAAPASDAVEFSQQPRPEELVTAPDVSHNVMLRMTCKLLDAGASTKIDAAWKDAIKHSVQNAYGIVSIERAICKKELDYIVSLKFVQQDALDAFLASDIMQGVLEPQIKQLSHLYAGGMEGVEWRTLAVESLL